MIKDLSAKLVAAAAAINAKSREAYVAEQQSLESRKKPKMPMQPVPKAEPAAVTTAKKMAEAVEGTVPKTPKEKELAAKHGHPKRITFGDVLKARGVQKEEVEVVYEANIQPTSAKSRSHIGNLSNPVVNSVERSGKEIGLITKQPSGEYYAHHSAAKLAHAQSGTFDTKDKAHQFIRDAHAKAIKNGTLKARGVQKEEVEQIAELSISTLTRVKHAANAAASDASRDGDEAKADKRSDLAGKASNKAEMKYRAAGLKPSGQHQMEEKEESAAHEKAEKKPNAFNWRTNPTKLPKKPGELTGHDSKKISTGTVYTKKFTNEDTSYSVEHEMFGEGNTLPGQEAEDGSWVDVMFAEGIKRVPADELFVTEAKVGDSHIHVSPVGGGKYKVHAVGSKFSDGIKVGEHLTDTHLDDFAEMGGKIKHVKPEKKD